MVIDVGSCKKVNTRVSVEYGIYIYNYFLQGAPIQNAVASGHPLGLQPSAAQW